MKRKGLAGFSLDVLKVPHLRMLTLDTCALSCIPPQIALRLLDLSHNRLETLYEEAMAGMCAKLNLLSVLPLSLVKARHLKILDVSVNRLTQLPQGKDIDASGNVLRGLPDEMRALTHLKRLNLCRNLLGSGSIPSTLGNSEVCLRARSGLGVLLFTWKPTRHGQGAPCNDHLEMTCQNVAFQSDPAAPGGTTFSEVHQEDRSTFNRVLYACCATRSAR